MAAAGARPWEGAGPVSRGREAARELRGSGGARGSVSGPRGPRRRRHGAGSAQEVTTLPGGPFPARERRHGQGEASVPGSVRGHWDRDGAEPCLAAGGLSHVEKGLLWGGCHEIPPPVHALVETNPWGLVELGEEHF